MSFFRPKVIIPITQDIFTVDSVKPGRFWQLAMLSWTSQGTTRKEKLSSESGITLKICELSGLHAITVKKSPNIAVQQEWKCSVYTVSYWRSVLILFTSEILIFENKFLARQLLLQLWLLFQKPVWNVSQKHHFHKGDAYSFGWEENLSLPLPAVWFKSIISALILILCFYVPELSSLSVWKLTHLMEWFSTSRIKKRPTSWPFLLLMADSFLCLMLVIRR